jgi:hypothetical protein
VARRSFWSVVKRTPESSRQSRRFLHPFHGVTIDTYGKSPRRPHSQARCPSRGHWPDTSTNPCLFRDVRVGHGLFGPYMIHSQTLSFGLTELRFLLQQSVRRQVAGPDHRIGTRVKSRYGSFEVSVKRYPHPEIDPVVPSGFRGIRAIFLSS